MLVIWKMRPRKRSKRSRSTKRLRNRPMLRTHSSHPLAITAKDTEAEVLIQQGKFEEATTKIQELVAISEAAKQKFPDDLDVASFSLQAIDTAGRLALAKGDFDTGISKLQEYIESLESISSKFSRECWIQTRVAQGTGRRWSVCVQARQHLDCRRVFEGMHEGN